MSTPGTGPPLPPRLPRGRRMAAAVRRHPGLVLVALPCLIVTCLLAAGLRSPAAGASPAAGTRAEGLALVPQDRQAPDFSLPLLDGSGRSGARALRGQVAVLTFWASWCAACRSEADGLRQLSAAYRARGVRFLGVDHRDRSGPARAFAAAHDLGYPSVVDHSGDLLAAYGAVGMPSTFVIDRQGQIRYMTVGVVDTAALRRGLDRILAGRPLPAGAGAGQA